jgi:hypothetical protein
MHGVLRPRAARALQARESAKNITALTVTFAYTATGARAMADLDWPVASCEAQPCAAKLAAEIDT